MNPKRCVSLNRWQGKQIVQLIARPSAIIPIIIWWMTDKQNGGSKGLWQLQRRVGTEFDCKSPFAQRPLYIGDWSPSRLPVIPHPSIQGLLLCLFSHSHQPQCNCHSFSYCTSSSFRKIMPLIEGNRMIWQRQIFTRNTIFRCEQTRVKERQAKGSPLESNTCIKPQNHSWTIKSPNNISISQTIDFRLIP